jgi:hypothetical protein
MKKFILGLSAVILMAIVSCSKDKVCNCNDGGNNNAKSFIEGSKAHSALGSEAGCNAANTAVKNISSKASCSWS